MNADFSLLISEFVTSFNAFLNSSFEFFGINISLYSIVFFVFTCYLICAISRLIFGGRE